MSKRSREVRNPRGGTAEQAIRAGFQALEQGHTDRALAAVETIESSVGARRDPHAVGCLYCSGCIELKALLDGRSDLDGVLRVVDRLERLGQSVDQDGGRLLPRLYEHFAAFLRALVIGDPGTALQTIQHMVDLTAGCELAEIDEVKDLSSGPLTSLERYSRAEMYLELMTRMLVQFKRNPSGPFARNRALLMESAFTKAVIAMISEHSRVLPAERINLYDRLLAWEAERGGEGPSQATAPLPIEEPAAITSASGSSSTTTTDDRPAQHLRLRPGGGRPVRRGQRERRRSLGHRRTKDA